jgi:hypothetical protein
MDIENGVWARKQMEARTPIGVKMVELFYQREKATQRRRRVGVAKDLAASKGAYHKVEDCLSAEIPIRSAAS